MLIRPCLCCRVLEQSFMHVCGYCRGQVASAGIGDSCAQKHLWLPVKWRARKERVISIRNRPYLA